MEPIASNIVAYNRTGVIDEPSEYPSYPNLLPPALGTMKIAVLKVDLSDETPGTTQATLVSRFNGASTSLRDYYLKASFNAFNVTSDIYPNSESWFS
nr:hypothetical protein [Candidatus Sigynarchaeota archaeon]